MLFIPDAANISVAGRSAQTGNDITVNEDRSANNTASAVIAGTLSNGSSPGSTGQLAGSGLNRLAGRTALSYFGDNGALLSMDANTPLNDASFGLVSTFGNERDGYIGAYHTGNATLVGDVPTNVTATYRGVFAGTEVGIGQDLAASRPLFGVTTLSADFGAGTIAGVVPNLVAGNGQGGVAQANYGLGFVGNITGNAYTGTTSFIDTSNGVDVAAGTVTNSAFNGAFYGANAAETAGAVSIEGINPVGNNIAVVGSYGAIKQ